MSDEGLAISRSQFPVPEPHTVKIERISFILHVAAEALDEILRVRSLPSWNVIVGLLLKIQRPDSPGLNEI